jgi:WD40 repeat protein
MRRLDGHGKDVRGVAFLPDGRLISVAADKTARIWDCMSGSGTVIHKGRGQLYALAIAPDGRTVAFAGRNSTPENPVVLYNLEWGKVTATLHWAVEDRVWRYPRLETVVEPVARSIWSLSFSADGAFLAAVGRKPGGGNISNGGGGYCWPIGRKRTGTEVPDQSAYAVRFAPTGTMLAVTSQRRVRFFTDATMARERVSYPVQCDWAPAVTFFPSAARAAIAAGSYVHLVDLDRWRKPVKVKSESRIVTGLAITPDGRSLLVGGKPGRVEVFDVTSSTPVKRAAFDFDVGGVHDLAVAPDGLTFAIAGDRALLLCDVDAS